MTSASPHQDKQIEALKALVRQQADAISGLLVRVRDLEREAARQQLAKVRSGRVQKIAP